ncbi:MAG: acyltransferase [Bacteroidaceae bacterium]|nr:acyltransferase [Bacteroidaceae bacterium]
MLSHQIPDEFRDMRPYAPDELPGVFHELTADPQFMDVARHVVPHFEEKLAAMTATASGQPLSNLDVQKALIYPIVKRIIAECSQGITLGVPTAFDRATPHTFITNHRDIVLDSALLSALLVDNGFPTTPQIAIGDNLLIFPWIEKIVRINKSFIVRRSLHMREMLRASQLMSRYMHYVIGTERDNIWIAQREGRAKDSNDRTQESLLKMMAMGGEGSAIDRLRQLNLTPMALSYEYDPCDYLKAKEFQQKRDIEGFRKSKADDLENMRVGILGFKGRIHFEAAPCINVWLDSLDPATPKGDLFAIVAAHIDSEIFRSYRLFPGNLVALDTLRGNTDHADGYTAAERDAFLQYIDSRVAMVDLPHPDAGFLRHCLLTMYANPAINQLAL